MKFMTDWTPCYSRFATKLLMIIIERCCVQERKGKKRKKEIGIYANVIRRRQPIIILYLVGRAELSLFRYLIWPRSLPSPRVRLGSQQDLRPSYVPTFLIVICIRLSCTICIPAHVPGSPVSSYLFLSPPLLAFSSLESIFDPRIVSRDRYAI